MQFMLISLTTLSIVASLAIASPAVSTNKQDLSACPAANPIAFAVAKHINRISRPALSSRVMAVMMLTAPSRSSAMKRLAH
ncbi:hypothetical protein BJ165DRAFT_1490154 [Panaeolus papilionaceus]|nr:hypothetical protein BJ165DRAFT_1490154 [Panaeolus papilionaceus]